MSRSSEHVKKWRQVTKERIIKSMGGKCGICGYDKCTASLSLHHINPKEKEMSFGAIRGNPIAWKHIVVELRKCILLCNNCHGEVHYGKTKIPDDYKRFDESYVKYDIDKSKLEISTCPVCGKDVIKPLITCSRECASKRAGKIKWDEYDLQKMYNEFSIKRMAEIIGCSDVAVHKRLKKLNLK